MKSAFAVDASHDIAAYKAAQCGREAVPVTRLMDDMCDATAWLFDEERDASGEDPWTEIQGVDCKVDGSLYWVDVPGNCYVVLRPDETVFVQTKDIPTTST
jgi:hypothetical protein